MAQTATTEADTSQDFSDLAELGAALGKAAGKAQDQEKIKDAILDKIATLDEDAAKALFKNPAVRALYERISDEKAQASTDPPGTIRAGWIGNAEVQGFTKKEWQESDLRREREANRGGAGSLVTFTPTETLPVFWNGLRRQLIADEEITIEKCFKDVYDEHRRLTKLGAEHAGWLFRSRETVSDMSIITAEGARARGMAEQGWYKSGAGSIITVDAPKAAETESDNTANEGDEEA